MLELNYILAQPVLDLAAPPLSVGSRPFQGEFESRSVLFVLSKEILAQLPVEVRLALATAIFG